MDNEHRASLGVMECSETDPGGNWLDSSVNIPKASQSYILKTGKMHVM